MVRVSERIWQHWREIEELDEPVVVLLFSCDLPQREAIYAVTDAAGAAVRELEREFHARRRGGSWSTGHWSAAPVPGGVALRIDEGPSDFEGLVRLIAVGLEARGVDGSLSLYEGESSHELPEVLDLFECRLRTRGERHTLPNGGHIWTPSPEALTAAAAAGIEWCRGIGRTLPLSLAVGLVPPATLGPEEDVGSYLREGLELTADLGVVRLTSSAPDRFRTLSVKASMGRVTLIEGGATIPDEGWEPTVEQATIALEAASQWAVYGFVKRGSRRTAAELGSSLAQDWVPTPHMRPLSGFGEAFEDEFVPDAFGVQFLGEGYRNRLPEATGWTRSDAGGGVILAHRDAARWFDGSLVPFGGHPNTILDENAPVPEPVASARDDFVSILFGDEFLSSQ